MKHAREIADKRAERMAQLGYLRRDTIPHELIPTSLPLQEQLYKKRISKGRQIQYDDTYFHRDYEVVRCDTDIHGPTAKDEAIVAMKQYDMDAKIKQHEQEINEQRAKGRYEHALHDQHMDKEKERLFRALDMLDIHDRRRKQEVYEYGPVTNVATDPRRKQTLLEQFFEEKFHVGDERINIRRQP